MGNLLLQFCLVCLFVLILFAIKLVLKVKEGDGKLKTRPAVQGRYGLERERVMGGGGGACAWWGLYFTKKQTWGLGGGLTCGRERSVLHKKRGGGGGGGAWVLTCG